MWVYEPLTICMLLENSSSSALTLIRTASPDTAPYDSRASGRICTQLAVEERVIPIYLPNLVI